MSLVADYSSSSNSNSDNEDEINEKNNENEKKSLPLPSANTLLSSEKPGEVFSNPYKEAENAKIALLERHVKMVDPQAHLKKKNGRKICWNYRKGRCRFGSSCTYAHDSDLQSAIIDQNDEGKEIDIPLKVTISKPQSGLQIGDSTSSNFSNNKFCNSNTNNEQNLNKLLQNNNNGINNSTQQIQQQQQQQQKQRRRSGLNDLIVPSKRVMKHYNTLKNEKS